METSEKIERYLAHDLSPDDRLAFEAELAVNPVLQEMLGRKRAAQAIMAQLRHDALIERMKQWDAEKKRPVVVQNASLLPWIIVAVLLVAVLGAYYYFKSVESPSPEVQPIKNVENPVDQAQYPRETAPDNSDGTQSPKQAQDPPLASTETALPRLSRELLALYSAPNSTLSQEGVKGSGPADDIFDQALSNLKNPDSAALNVVLLSAMKTRGDADIEYRRQELLGHSYILLKNFQAAADCFKKNSPLSAESSWYYHFCLAFDYEKNKKEVDAFITNGQQHPYSEQITALARILKKK
jgi:hypothetical protein